MRTKENLQNRHRQTLDRTKKTALAHAFYCVKKNSNRDKKYSTHLLVLVLLDRFALLTNIIASKEKKHIFSLYILFLFGL